MSDMSGIDITWPTVGKLEFEFSAVCDNHKVIRVSRSGKLNERCYVLDCPYDALFDIWILLRHECSANTKRLLLCPEHMSCLRSMLALIDAVENRWARR